jgi:DNA-binding GntR family transcriptional regulator
MYDAVIAEHEKMILAFERRDPKAAGQAVFDHVSAARDRLLIRMAEREMFSVDPSAEPLVNAVSTRDSL